jgi:hypothetical protein
MKDLADIEDEDENDGSECCFGFQGKVDTSIKSLRDFCSKLTMKTRGCDCGENSCTLKEDEQANRGYDKGSSRF